jgi:hypothetical protein
MSKLTRLLAVTLLVCTAFSAYAVNATIKRELPLWYSGIYLRNTPMLGLAPGLETLAFDGLQMWTVNRDAATVQRWDPVNNGTNGPAISVPGINGPRRAVFDGTYMWVFPLGTGKAYKYDTSGKLVSGFPITIPGGVEGAVFDGDSIWASTAGSHGYYSLTRINVTSKVVTEFSTATPSAPGGVQGAVVFDGQYLWVGRSGLGLVQIDVKTGGVVWSDGTIDGGNGVDSLAFDGEFLWIAAQDSNLVMKMDPSSHAIVRTFSVVDPHAVAYDGSLIWAAGRSSSIVSKIDPRTEQFVESISVAPNTYPSNLAYDGTHMWLTCNGNGNANSGAIYKFLAHY